MTIIKKKRARGVSYKIISSLLGMDKLRIPTAEVRRIGMGHYPGEKVAKRLGWPVKCHSCHRRIVEKKPRQPAPKIGRDVGWIEYYIKKTK